MNRTRLSLDLLGERASTIFENLPVGVIVTDHHGRFMLFNAEAERILGFHHLNVSPCEWSSVFGCYLPDGENSFPCDELPLTRALAGHPVRDQLMLVRNSCHLSGLWLRVSSRPLTNGSGAISGALVVLHDVTQARRTVEQVMFLSRAVEQTADAIILTDRSGAIQYANAAFEATTGYSREEVLGSTPRILKSGKQHAEFYDQMWSRIVQGQSYHGTIVNRRKNGELYWAEETISPIKDDAGAITHFVSVAKDVTALRKKQEQDWQLHLAREVQQRFYNTEVAVRGYDIGIAAHPADETGGDYFDILPMPDGSFYAAIGDVSGHGLGSALVMALTRAYVRSYCFMALAVDDVLGRVNRMLTMDLESGRFVTLLLLRVQNDALTYASAGHVPGLVFKESGDLKSKLESTGLPLGIFVDATFPSATVPVANGDTFLLLTDGAIESTAAGDEHPENNIVEYITASIRNRVPQIAEGIYELARGIDPERRQEDDITAVVLKRQYQGC